MLLAACGSSRGASRWLIGAAAKYRWLLISSVYCAEEVEHNLSSLGRNAKTDWERVINPRVRFVRPNFVLDRALIFPVTKDRPIAITALAVRAAWLLTLDEKDFQRRLGDQIYGLRVASPGKFLLTQRESGLVY